MAAEPDRRRAGGSVPALVLAATVTVALALVASAAAAAAPVSAPSARVVVVDLPGLRWSDVPQMPHLQALLRAGSVGVLSVKSEGETTRCGDGLLEVSAMTRVPSGVRSCTPDPAALRVRYRHNRYDAQVGLLGDLLGGRIVAVDAAAAVVAAGSAGPAAVTPIDEALAANGPAVVMSVDPRLDDPPDRAVAARAADDALGRLARRLPSRATLIAFGGADGSTGGPQLHPLVVVGPGWSHRELTSASTGRAPFVQLFDVGPTLLHLQGVDTLPTSVAGRPVHATGSHVRAVASYVDLDRHARRALTVGHPAFSAVCGVLVAALLLSWRMHRLGAAVAAAAAAFPAVTWLLQLLPWWRWPVVTWAVVAAVIAAVAGLAGRVAAPYAVAAFTAVALIADQVAGAPLQIAAPFGDNPLVAGRFHGMGNVDFAVTMGALLFCTAFVRRVGLVALMLAVAVVVDGAPMLGDDVGGLLTLVAASAVVVAGRVGVRMNVRRAVVAGAGAVALAVAVGLADYARPASRQTHAGRFVGQVLHGGAWRVLHRKLDAVAGSLSTPAVTLLVVVVLAAAVTVVARGAAASAQPALRAAAAGAAVVAVVGSVLNDSGVFVAAGTAVGFVAPVLTIGLRPGRPL